jgi:uncharacterized damage-inducible protein DinB
MADERALLLRLIDEAFGRKAWHGPNLRGSVRRVDAVQAAWRPGRGRHSIAEIAVHCAYWKYAVRRRIRGDKRGSFPLHGSNWFAIPDRLTQSQWRAYLALLDEEHASLCEAVVTASWAQLCTSRQGTGKSPAAHVYGIALHDTYHTGQVQTLKALYKSRR